MKRLFFVLALAAAAVTANAQDTAAQAPAQEQTFTLKLTATQLNSIVNALGQRPFNEVASLIVAINTQISAQLPQRQPAVKPTDKSEAAKDKGKN